MGKLKELLDKGVRLIVVDASQPTDAEALPTEEGHESAAQAADLGAGPEPPLRTPARSAVPASTADFAAVYAEAGIELPAHGYGVEKVAEMLQNKRLASLEPTVRATAVLAALEAAGVALRDVVQDAMLRDRALDAFEAAKQREVAEIEATAEARIKALQQELEALSRKINDEIGRLNAEAEAAGAAFGQLRQRKQAEEQRLFEVVSQFVQDNPVTRATASGPKPAPPRAS